MAHTARLSTLTDELVKLLTGLDPTKQSNARNWKKAKEIATRGLRSTQHGRTNQFDIQERLAGLEEKFFVLSREDLAAAVKLRLEELDNQKFRWTPESLSLIISLSDKPATNVNLENLEHLRVPESPPPLTWKDIIADDPLDDEEGIWDDIDYGAVSSEDEIEDLPSKRIVAKKTATLDMIDIISPEACLVPMDTSQADALHRAQFWKSCKERHNDEDSDSGIETEPSTTKDISELQAVREILFMLGGLPTSLFRIFKGDQLVEYGGNFVLKHISAVQFSAMMDEFSAVGGSLLRLRHWVEQDQSVSLLQTFQSAVESKLSFFDMELSELHQQHIHTSIEVLVSLQQLLTKIRDLARPLQRLSEVVVRVTVRSSPVPYMFLEELFEAISLAQLTGETDVYESLGIIFFQCFSTYLRPIRQWMELGQLGLDKDSFFVEQVEANIDLSSLWHERFRLRYNGLGKLYIPSFLQPRTKRIFNTGKSIVFLHDLGRSSDALPGTTPEPQLEFDAVCRRSGSSAIEPFSNQFDAAFDQWIQSKHSLSSEILRGHLFNDCGLWRSLDALEFVFLSRNGVYLQTFADAMFEKLDGKSNTWNDRFVMTDVAHQIFNELVCVDAQKLTVRTVAPKHKGRTLKNLASISIDYSLPWPILNVIQRKSIPIFQQISRLLLQCYRAKYLLQQVTIKFTSRHKDPTSQVAAYLHHRLVWFADNIRSYLAEIVLPKLTSEMRSSLAKSEDIDEMSAVFAGYVNAMQDQCLLTKSLSPIMQSIVSILDLSVTLSDALARDNHTGLFSSRKSSGKGSMMGKSEASRRSRHMRRPIDESSSDEEESDEEGYSGNDEDAPSFTTLSETLEKAREQFDRVLPFVVSGLKGVSRTRGEQQWQLLADKLDWEVKSDQLL